MEDILWIDLQKSPEPEIPRDTKPKQVRIVLPPLSFPHPCQVFESLSMIIERFKDKPIFILPLSGDEKYDNYLTDLFRRDTEHEEAGKGIFIFSAEIIHWNISSFSKSCASLLATEILQYAIKEEKKYISDFLNTTSHRIKEEFDRWKEGMSELIQSAGEKVKWLRFVWNFGFGRKDKGYVRLATLMNPGGLANKDIPGIFHLSSFPDPGFIDAFQEFERTIKTFYCPDFNIIQIDVTHNLSLEKSNLSTELPFESTFWKSAITQINNSLNQLLAILKASHRNQRKQVLRQTGEKLSDIRSNIHLEVEREINHIKSLNNLLELNPERFKRAYEKVYESIFSVIIEIFPHLWRLRGLPLWIPSLTYPLRAPIRHAIGILRETLRLLLFYRVCYHVVSDFRKTVEEYSKKVADLRRALSGYAKHIENLEQELNIIKSPTSVPLMEKSDFELKVAPDRFPEHDDVLKALGDKLKILCDELTESISNMRKLKNFKPGGTIAEFMPSIIHAKEAWRAAQNITEALQKWESFQNILNNIQTNISANTSANTNVLFYRKKSKKVVSILDEKLFLEWKKKALEEKQGEFKFDILTPQIENEELARDFLLKNAHRLEFFYSDGYKTWVPEQWFKFVPKSIRYFFFQRKIGFTETEMKYRIDNSQKEELRKWFNWFFHKEKNRDCSELADVKSEITWSRDIVEVIFSILQNYYCTDPTSHKYYGTADLGEDELRFMLKDTLCKPLMKLFAPDDMDNCEPRRFPNDIYIANNLDLDELKKTIYALLNIAIYEERNVEEFKQFFSSY